MRSERLASNALVGVVRSELPFLGAALTLVAFELFADDWLVGLESFYVAAPIFALLFGVMLWAAFGVVRHADALAQLLGEPYGTLILTLAVVGIEVSLMAAIMLTGKANPTLARDTMFAVLMIVLNGLVGVAIVVGCLIHREQEYSLQGAHAFLSVLVPLAVFALVLPRFTVTTADPTFSPGQELFFALITVLLYAAFLGIQTVRHRGFFTHAPSTTGEEADASVAGVEAEADSPQGEVQGLAYHAALLVLTILPIVLLSKRMAKLVDYGIEGVGAPVAIGGVIIALLVLAPEGLAAMKAARANQMQRSVNLLLGSAVSTIGLTVPAVLAISLFTGQSVILGLDIASAILLVLTLFVSALTFGGVRTNLLQGFVHLVMFLVYVELAFAP